MVGSYFKIVLKMILRIAEGSEEDPPEIFPESGRQPMDHLRGVKVDINLIPPVVDCFLNSLRRHIHTLAKKGRTFGR